MVHALNGRWREGTLRRGTASGHDQPRPHSTEMVYPGAVHVRVVVSSVQDFTKLKIRQKGN
jgi:hypothetical protein